MEIIKLNLSHLDELYNLYLEQFKNESWTKQQIKDSFNNSAIDFYGVFDNNSLVAFASVMTTVDDINLLDIATKEKYKRRGIAKSLLAFLITLKNKEQSFSLEVKETNQPAIKLYQDLGFKTLSIRKKYYKDGSDAFCMFLMS